MSAGRSWCNRSRCLSARITRMRRHWRWPLRLRGSSLGWDRDHRRLFREDLCQDEQKLGQLRSLDGISTHTKVTVVSYLPSFCPVGQVWVVDSPLSAHKSPWPDLHAPGGCYICHGRLVWISSRDPELERELIGHVAERHRQRPDQMEEQG